MTSETGDPTLRRGNAGGCDVAWEAAGEGPAVVFVHAGICDGRMWDDQWDVVTSGRRAVRFDLPGAGASPAVDRPYDAVAVASGVLDLAGVDRAVLVGASMGGAIAVQMALTHPERVAGLVLVGAGVSGFEGRKVAQEKVLAAALEAAAAAGNADAVLELDLRLWVDGIGRGAAALPAVRERVRSMDRIIQANERAHPNGKWESVGPPAAERLSTVDVPTLVAVGAFDVPRLREAARFLAREIRAARFVLYPDAAHFPSMELPDAFNRDLLSFLQDLGW